VPRPPQQDQPVAPPRASAPPFVGLTGGVAAGKSEAMAAFARGGAATLSSDAVVHELLEDPEVRSRLAERWGAGVVADGRLDRGRVGAIVFERPEELAWLESTLHPLVAERVADWRRSLPPDTKLAVVEVPLLFEAGMESEFDATVAVVAEDEARAGRAGARGTELLDGRNQRQLSQGEKASRATYVIGNDGSLEELEGEVARVFSLLAEKTPGAA
jgi:dephospho-CoA kinase